MKAAALALVLGLDPWAYLAAAPNDARIMTAVIEEARGLRVEYDTTLAKAIGGETAEALLPGLVKAFTRAIEALAKARG